MTATSTETAFPELPLLALIAYLVWALVVSAGLILQRRSPVATLGWLLTLVLLPYVGAVLWIFFGPRRLRRRRLRYAEMRRRVSRAASDLRRHVHGPEMSEEIRVRYRQLATLATRLDQLPPARADEVRLYFDGDECYAAIEAAIAAARHHAHLEYYIWEPGTIADRVLDLLCERARAGVAVRVLVDDVGSPRASEKYFAKLEAAGGEIAWFNPIRFTRFRPTILNFRTHRKIVVIDGRVGFIGGMNLSNLQSGQSSGGTAWRDTHARITGAPVSALQRVFLEDWLYAAGPCALVPEFFCEPGTGQGPGVQIIASGPDTTHYAIQRFGFAAIASARQSVRLTTPYFVPDEPTLEALKAAALRGVDVELLVPKRSDSWLVWAAARSYFDEISRAGIKVFEYGPPMLHAKALVIDATLAIVGTANTDNRSFRLNFEVVAAIYDAATARSLVEQFDRDLARAERYRPMYTERHGLWPRLASSTARLFSPLL